VIEHFHSIAFVEGGAGWLVTDRVLHTYDAGLHWIDRTPPSAQRRFDVVAIDTNVAWLVAEGEIGEHLYRTIDGGAHWSMVDPRPGYLEVSGSLFTDGDVGWIATRDEIDLGRPDPIALHRTVDGGKTWTRAGELPCSEVGRQWVGLASTPKSTFVQVECDAPKDAFPSLWVTFDEGARWTKRSLPPACVDPYMPGHFVTFASDRDGYVLTDGVGTSDSELWATHDGARTWSRVSLAIPTGETASAAFQDAGPSFARSTSGGSSLVGTLGEFTTTDGGVTWKTHVEPASSWPGGTFSRGADLWRWEDTSDEAAPRLHRSMDAGATWIDVEASAPTTPPRTIGAAWELTFAGPTTGWRIHPLLDPKLPDDRRYVVVTTDGGHTFHAVQPP
jgi:hypothetical protein